MKVSPARLSAYQILFKIEKEKAFSSILLPKAEKNLGRKDSSLCHQLVLGTLRKQLKIDAIIIKLTKKHINKLDLQVVIALRLGIYQLLFLDKVPAYSAINESVNLVKIAKKKSASGLVNAVLRKVSKGSIEIKFENEIDRISIDTSHPKWLIEKWISQFGQEETLKIAKKNNNQPIISFRLTRKYFNQSQSKQNQVIDLIRQNSIESNLIESSFIAKQFNSDLFELADKGYIYFQDEGSQMVGKSVAITADEKLLDVCASPGSKTSYISRNVDNQTTIVAGDFHEHRISNLAQNCNRQEVSKVDFVRYDATKNLPFSDECFDIVLVDAPCSGTGTIRNNPEIRYNLSEKDIYELSSKQLEILLNASKTVRKKGNLIYSTCSIETEENERVINSFLKMKKDFKKIKPNLDEKFLTDDGFAKIFPHRDDMDGFFISVLIRS